MKITTFNSFIATSRTDETIRLFEELGFERRHKKEGIEIAKRDDTVIRMKDGNGFYLDVLQTDSGPTRDTMGIRMNVDDFDEAIITAGGISIKEINPKRILPIVLNAFFISLPASMNLIQTRL